jgi:hypothetical protein
MVSQHGRPDLPYIGVMRSVPHNMGIMGYYAAIDTSDPWFSLCRRAYHKHDASTGKRRPAMMDIEAMLAADEPYTGEELYSIVRQGYMVLGDASKMQLLVDLMDKGAIRRLFFYDDDFFSPGEAFSRYGFDINDDMEQCGRWLSRVMVDRYIDNNQGDFWGRFKDEFYILVCTNDKKYSDLRRQITQYGGKSQVALTSAISAAMAVNLGVTVTAVLVPLCAICLLVILRLGRNTFCGRAPVTLTLVDARRLTPALKEKKGERMGGLKTALRCRHILPHYATRHGFEIHFRADWSDGDRSFLWKSSPPIASGLLAGRIPATAARAPYFLANAFKIQDFCELS